MTNNGANHEHPRPRNRVGLLIWVSQEFARHVLAGAIDYSLSDPTLEIEVAFAADRFKNKVGRGSIEGFDGLITTLEVFEEVDLLARQEFPLVATPLMEAPESVLSVTTDRVELARMAVEHFRQAYLPRVVLNTFAQFGNTELDKAFRDAANEAGLEVLPPFQHSPATHGTDAESQWLASLPLPIGVFCPKDGVADGLIHQAHDLGIKVPDELAVLGTGNDPIRCLRTRPTLSSIALPGEEIGRKAAELMSRLLSGEEVQSIRLSPLGVAQRGSTRMVAIDDPIVARAAAYLRDHAAERITIAGMVDELRLTRRSFQRRFKNIIGRTPIQELIRLRVELAKLRLAQTDASMFTVAIDCGFGDQAALTKHFRQQTGMTPTDYRAKFRST